MKRPGDQAKLLVMYLLRSSANALANNQFSNSAVSAVSSTPIVGEVGHICLRLARKTDVESIRKCNLATLPENYNTQFYNTHMRNWPDLALVAEHIVPRKIGRYGAPSPEEEEDKEPNIVGYVLGKIEERNVPAKGLGLPPPTSDCKDYYDMHGERYVRQSTGHVTSLAVLGNYRRRGIAASLLNQLHTHMDQCHKVRSVGLHVRQSNKAAIQLYQNAFGYNIDQVLNRYYADGEQAYYMRKILYNQEQQNKPQSLRSRLSLTSRSKPWLARDSPWQLPRMIWYPPMKQDDASTVVYEEEEEVRDVEVMTGT